MTKAWPILFAVSACLNILQFACSRVPVPREVKASRAHVANLAVRCSGRTQEGFPCGNPTRHPSGRCWHHRSSAPKVAGWDRT